MLKIMLIESQTIVRKAVKKVLETNTGIEVVADVSNEISAVRILAGGVRPEVIICEILDEDPANIGFCRIKRRWPKINVVVLSVFNIEIFVYRAFLMGCSGYLTRNVGLEELFYGLDRVRQGKRYLCMDVTEKLLAKNLKETS